MKKEEMTYLKKVTTQSVVQRVIDSLTDAMINRHLRPGDKIPTESELAESLGVGRNSIREAIKIWYIWVCWKSEEPREHLYAKDFQKV